MSVALRLSNGMVTQVDDDDVARLARFTWRAKRNPGRRTWYAIADPPRGAVGPQSIVRMHRVILGFGRHDPQVDHINGDGLDNTRKNLRPATGSQNLGNTGLRATNTSGFKGVSRSTKCTWTAHITYQRRGIYLGTYSTPEAAAQAYDDAALALWGEFARPNSLLTARETA